MSYASYDRIPHVRTYESVAYALSQTKPVRGRTPVTYPLSERRYADAFTFRYALDAASKPRRRGLHTERPATFTSNPSSTHVVYEPLETDIELMLYERPIVVLHKPTEQMHEPNFEVTLLCFWHYWSISDCRFVLSLLRRYVSEICTKGGRLVITTNTGARYVVPAGEGMRFRLDPVARAMHPVADYAPHAWRMNRAKANKVRAVYGEFYRYMKGMIALRKQRVAEMMRPQDAQNTQKPQFHVPLTREELLLTSGAPIHYPNRNVKPSHPMGMSRVDLVCLDNSKYVNLLKKPKRTDKMVVREKYGHNTWQTVDSEQPYLNWRAATQEFISLISAKSDDPEQAQKFAKAFATIGLQVFAHMLSQAWAGQSHTLYANVERLSTTADEILFKYHSAEVFEFVQVKESSVPSDRYETWVDRD